jgi:TPR repeat protein
LAKLLLDAPDRPERDYVQAMAWLELAAEQGNSQAKAIAAKEMANLTPAQERWKLVRK